MSDAVDSQHGPATTTNATAQRTGATYPGVPDTISYGCYAAQIVAHQHGGVSRSVWHVFFSFYVAADGTITLGSAGLSTLLHTTDGGLGALGWSVAPYADSGTGEVGIQVTGATGTTVEWGVNYTAYWTYED